MKERKVVVSIRVSDFEFPSSDSIKKACDTCGELVWISPSTLETVPAPFVIECVQCMDSTRQNEAVEFQPFNETQREEVAEATGLLDDEVTDLVERAFKTFGATSK